MLQSSYVLKVKLYLYTPPKSMVEDYIYDFATEYIMEAVEEVINSKDLVKYIEENSQNLSLYLLGQNVFYGVVDRFHELIRIAQHPVDVRDFTDYRIYLEERQDRFIFEFSNMMFCFMRVVRYNLLDHYLKQQKERFGLEFESFKFYRDKRNPDVLQIHCYPKIWDVVLYTEKSYEANQCKTHQTIMRQEAPII